MRLLRPGLFSISCLMAAACGSDPVLPTLETIAGDYEATSFQGNGTDVLLEGGSLTMSLESDGTVTGAMFVTAAAGGPVTADLVGTYTLSGSSVTFTQAADTFVRDADWTWEDGVLDGMWSGASGSVSVRMVRE